MICVCVSIVVTLAQVCVFVNMVWINVVVRSARVWFMVCVTNVVSMACVNVAVRLAQVCCMWYVCVKV